MSEAGAAAEKAPALTRKGGATRAALLDSTIELLASTGYAATTTQAVLDHSGLSRGSLLHQFRTRELLMVAAAEEAVERMFGSVADKLAHVNDPIEALRKYPDALWVVQNEPAALAFAELQLASRWEKGLQARLRESMRTVNERIGREVNEAAAGAGIRDVRRLAMEIGALISAMQGLAVSSTLVADESRVQDILVALSAHYRSCLEEAISVR